MTETTRTETHEFYILPAYRGLEGFRAEYRSLHPKTGQPWQASKHLIDGADIHPEGYRCPVVYSTVELARAAVTRQIAKLASRRPKAKA